jgi:hypothetical protein
MALPDALDPAIRHPDTSEPTPPGPLPPRPDVLAIEIAAVSRGVAKGLSQGLSRGIVGLCEVLEIPLDADRLAVLERLAPPDLQSLLDAIRTDRRWP